jgi:hypothetical protein
VRLIAFAVVATERTEEGLENKVDQVLERETDWIENTELRLTAKKTEAVLMIGRRRPGEVVFHLRGQESHPQRSVRYLGIRIDRAMTFGPHVEEVAAKAEKMTGSLGRIMPNLGGARSTRRKLLSSVVHSKLLYGAAVWSQALKTKKNIEVLTTVQRRVLLRIASGYRTISAVALQVITGVLPVEVQVRRQELLRRRPEVRQEVTEDLMREWQRRWNGTHQGVWTRTLIPDIRAWAEKRHGELNYYQTQALSEHGCFASFTHKIGKQETDCCWFCEDRGGLEYTLFVCDSWNRERLLLMRKTAKWPTSENYVEILLRSQVD